MSLASRKGLLSRAEEGSNRTGDTLTFPTAAVWAAWLKKNHARADGLWVRFFKKDSGVPTLSHAQALEEALCWGWIDGRLMPLDGRSWLRRFTPRRLGSGWSKRNRELADRLTLEGRMKLSGYAQVAAAKVDGRWDRAYDPQSALSIPDDFRRAVALHKEAETFFGGLNRANLYAISYRLQTAKRPETRVRRFEALLQMLKEGRTFH